MKNRNRAAWMTRAGVVASLAVAGVLGTTIPAQAASSDLGTRAVAAAVTSAGDRAAASAITDTQREGAAPNSIQGSHSGSEARSWGTILRLAKDAIKKVPGVWNKAVSSAKKGYATFVKTAWPSIKVIVNVISYSITAWDIWNLFR